MMKQLRILKSITNRGDQSLGRYMTDISRLPMLSPDEEVDLAREIHEGGQKAEQAKNKLILGNLRFVVSVAKQYQHYGIPLEDLIDEGNIGLVKAAERYDDTRGFKFISYAVWWVRQAICSAIMDQGRMVRLPMNQAGTLSKLNQEIAKFEQEHQRQPSAEELADISGIDEDKVRKAMDADNHQVSIDAPVTDDSETRVSDMMSSGDEFAPDKESEHESMAKDLEDVLRDSLTNKEINILKDYYGLGRKEEGLEEIGSKYDLTRERVRQIREKSLNKIRHNIHARCLKKYLG